MALNEFNVSQNLPNMHVWNVFHVCNHVYYSRQIYSSRKQTFLVCYVQN